MHQIVARRIERADFRHFLPTKCTELSHMYGISDLYSMLYFKIYFLYFTEKINETLIFGTQLNTSIMRKLFYSIAILSLIAFLSTSCSSSGSGPEKFLGTWKDTGSAEHYKITIIKKGKGNTYKVVSPGAVGTKYEDMKPAVYRGLKYNDDKDELYTDKGQVIEVVYSKDTKTIQGFVNHMPATSPQRKVKE